MEHFAMEKNGVFIEAILRITGLLKRC